MGQAHEALRHFQLKVRQDDQEEPLLFAPGDLRNPVPAPDATECPDPRKRIPTIEWMSREMKKEVEKAVQNGQECRLCSFKTRKRRIRIHIRQHMCMHYCHCGYQHISRDQIAEHQRLTRHPGHARSRCRIYMVAIDQFPEFREKTGWPDSTTFGPLLPITRKINRVKVESRPSTSSSTSKLQPRARSP